MSLSSSSAEGPAAPLVARPMGYTGNSLGLCYMGAPKLDGLMTRVHGLDSRQPKTHRHSLSKLLRLNILPRLAPHLWCNQHKLIFCAFRKTVEAVRRGLLPVGEARRRAPYFLGSSDCRSPIFEALAVRLHQAHVYMNLIRPATFEGLALQLWIDTHLDLASHIRRNGTEDLEIQAFLLRPHGRRVVWAGDLPDFTSLIPMANMWHETRPTLKDNIVCMIVHLFLCKTQHKKCQIRNIIRILWIYAQRHPVIMDLVKDLLHVTLLGNYPHANYRPTFPRRIFLRESNIRFMRSASFDHSIVWMHENRRLVYYALKEFWIYTVGFCSATESVLRETQYHDMHRRSVIQVLDTARSIVDRGGPPRDMLDRTEEELRRVHNECLKFLTKLRKGSFVRVVHAKLKTWAALHLRVRLEMAVARISAFGPALLSGVDPQTRAPLARTSLVTALPAELAARIARRLDYASLCRLGMTCRAMRVLTKDPWVQRGSIRASRSVWEGQEDTAILEEASVVDLDQETLSALCVGAQYAAARTDGFCDMRWMKMAGMSPEGYVDATTLYTDYDCRDIPDNAIGKRFLPIYERSPRDFAILYTFVSEMDRFRNLEIRVLDLRTLRHQAEAIRMRAGLEPWQPTPENLGRRSYCGGCARWADVVVIPLDGDTSGATNVYALGLAAASFDAIDGVLHCKRAMTQGCELPLRQIDMLGVAVRMSGPKRPPRWYALCATCGILTTLSSDRMTDKGPDCGMHQAPPRTIKIRDASPLTQARTEAGLVRAGSVIQRCWYCDCKIAGARRGVRVRVLDKKMHMIHITLCGRDRRAANYVFRDLTVPPVAQIRSAIMANRDRHLLLHMYPASKMRTVWAPLPDKYRTG